MAEHTPGKWRVEEGATYAGPPMVIAENGTIIGGFMGSGTQSVAEDNANARLCAAAPDLLAACEALVLDGDIAKARGLAAGAILKVRGDA